MSLLIDKTRPLTKEYVVVDVGAFHGYFAQEIIDKVPNVNITMMEANPHCEKYLKEIGKEYHIAVLSDKKKEKQSFYIRKGYETCTGASLYKENTEAYKDAAVLKVNTSTLDEYELYPNGIDLLKIDVQGSELDVLKGSINTLTRVKSILVECSISEYNEGGARIMSIITYLKGKGFYPNEIIGEHWLEKGKKVKGKEVKGMNQLDILFTHDKEHECYIDSTTSTLKYSFKNFIPNGMGADIIKIAQLDCYCKLNDITLYMNKDDDWLIANHGNWRTLFDSMMITDDEHVEVTVDLMKKVYNTEMTFDMLKESVDRLYTPKEKYKVDVQSDNKYAVVHVRRGDKVKGNWREGIYHELDEYLQHLKQYDNKDIFVMTDSPDVAEEAKSKGCMIDESEERRDGYVYNLYHKNEYTENDMEDELNIFFKNMEIFRHASDLVGSNSSYYYVIGQLLNGKKGISLSNNLRYHPLSLNGLSQ